MNKATAFAKCLTVTVTILAGFLSAGFEARADEASRIEKRDRKVLEELNRPPEEQNHMYDREGGFTWYGPVSGKFQCVWLGPGKWLMIYGVIYVPTQHVVDTVAHGQHHCIARAEHLNDRFGH